MMREAPSVIHAILKQRTSALHQAVETTLGALLCDDISLDQFAALQKTFYGFYQPIEERLLSIRGWDDPEFELESRLKVPFLVRDLAALASNLEELPRLPCCTSLPRLESVSEALGCLYVLEGATLGGKIIARRLKDVLPRDALRGCSFFESYGEHVGQMWSAFLRVLARHCEKHGDEDVIVQSACETFMALDRWLADDA